VLRTRALNALLGVLGRRPRLSQHDGRSELSDEQLADVLKVRLMPESANRIRGRVETILDFAGPTEN
jgi:hypothetical protein